MDCLFATLFRDFPPVGGIAMFNKVRKFWKSLSAQNSRLFYLFIYLFIYLFTYLFY